MARPVRMSDGAPAGPRGWPEETRSQRPTSAHDTQIGSPAGRLEPATVSSRVRC